MNTSTKRVRLSLYLACAAMAGLAGTALVRSGSTESKTPQPSPTVAMKTTPPSPMIGASANEPSARTPEGAQFPGCWQHTFAVPKQIALNTDFQATIKITATLFDVEDLEIIPAVSGNLKCVKGPAWKGTLKKGENRVMALTLRATTTGFNGAYGLVVKAPKFYDEVLAYVNAQHDGSYATQDAKDSIAEQVGFMRQSQPLYQEWVGSSIKVNERGEVNP